MIGLGIGAFVDGFARGYGLRADMDDRAFQREGAELQRQWAMEDRDYLAQERALVSSEREREMAKRGRIDAIESEARATFNAGVASGEYDPADFEKFWRQYALPRMRAELIAQGDMSGASTLMQWAESEDARDGGRLFASAMFKAQTGDHGGALEDAIRAGRLGGYIAGDFEITGKKEIRDENGRLVGYKVAMNDGAGNQLRQDIAIDDIPMVIASFANPVAAAQSQLEARAQTEQREGEFNDFARRETFKAGLSDRDADQRMRTDALKVLREQLAGDPLSGGVPGFDDLPRAEQERLIESEIALRTGRPAVPTPTLIVDERTGQPMMPRPNPVPAPASAPAASPTAGNAVINGRVDASLPAPTEAQAIESVATRLVQGGDPQELARELRAIGIAQERWPSQLNQILSQTAPGLGR